MNFTILRYETITSTNSAALEQARRGAKEGLCIVAREQTKGRGRHGREWVSRKRFGPLCFRRFAPEYRYKISFPGDADDIDRGL